MSTNPILEEIYAARRKLMEEAGGDLHKLVEAARARAIASGRTLVSPADLRTKLDDLSNQGQSLDDSSAKP